MTHHHQQREKILQSFYHKFYPPTAFHSAFQLLAQTATFAFIGKSGYTLAFANRIAHKGLHGETRAFRMGVVSLPSERFTRFGNPAWPGIRTANFAAFEPWSRALSKNAESLGTAMRSCVSLFRGVAAPLGCVIFFAFVEIAACTPCAQSFPRVQGGERYHYPRRALRASETPDGRLSKRLVCRFLRSMGIAPCATPIFLRIYRYPCR